MDNRTFLMGAAVGAGLVYVFDPQSGRRRRALVTNKLVRAGNATRDALDTTSRDVANRSRGILAAARGRWRSDEVSDDVLRERVRAKLGRACSHPRAIDVLVSNGNVTLRGPALAPEAPAMLGSVGSVRGVQSVINELDLHESAEDVPALQGEGRVVGPSLDVLQSNWAPATRAVVATLGIAAAGVLLAGYTRRAA
jgi:hypothetical protein